MTQSVHSSQSAPLTLTLDGLHAAIQILITDVTRSDGRPSAEAIVDRLSAIDRALDDYATAQETTMSKTTPAIRKTHASKGGSGFTPKGLPGLGPPPKAAPVEKGRRPLKRKLAKKSSPARGGKRR